MGAAMSQPGGHISEDISNKIDAEVKRIIETGYQIAKDILTTHAHEHEILSKALLEYETLSGEELSALARGESIKRESESAPKRGPIKSTLPSSRQRMEGDTAVGE